MKLSIGIRFIIITCCFILAYSGLVIYRAIKLDHKYNNDMMEKQAQLALEFELAFGNYIADHVRPFSRQHVEADEFIPEVMSSTFASRDIFERVRKALPDTIIKFSSDNPRNPLNLAGPEELKIIEYFRQHRDSDRWSGKIELEGRLYFAQFIARRMEADCLRCHGDPADAPASMIERYGSEAGFHQPVGGVMAMDMVAIPFKNYTARQILGVFRDAAILLAGLAVLLLAVHLVFQGLVTRRLKFISDYFSKSAGQKDYDIIPPLQVYGRDEMSRLVGSINLMAEEKKMRIQHEKALHLKQFCVDCAQDAIVIVDYEGYIIDVNEAGCRLANLAQGEILQRHLINYVDLCKSSEWPRFRDAFKNHKRKVIETLLRCADGKVIPVELTANHFEYDGAIYICAIIRDTCERKRTESILEQALNTAKLANRAKTDFIANMSHELRTPMNAILGFCDLLKTIDLPSEQKSWIEMIHGSGNHLMELINRVLDFSEIEKGFHALDRIKYSPEDILKELELLYSEKARKKGLILTAECVGDAPRQIITDINLLMQALANLVDNAVKFTEKGSISIQARSQSLGNVPGVCFRVADTGIGIPLNKSEQIFESFSQVDNSDSRRHEGVGLGLTMVKNITRLLGGTISLQNESENGAVFDLVIPVDLDRRDEALPADGRDGAASTARETQEEAEYLITKDEIRTLAFLVESELAQDPDMKQVLDIFLKDLPVRMKMISDALDKQDMAGLRQLICDIKGMGANIGFPLLTERAAIIESRIGETLTGDIDKKVRELQKICREIIAVKAD